MDTPDLVTPFRVWAVVMCLLGWAAVGVASGMFGWSADVVILVNLGNVAVWVSAATAVFGKAIHAYLSDDHPGDS